MSRVRHYGKGGSGQAFCHAVGGRKKTVELPYDADDDDDGSRVSHSKHHIQSLFTNAYTTTKMPSYATRDLGDKLHEICVLHVFWSSKRVESLSSECQRFSQRFLVLYLKAMGLNKGVVFIGFHFSFFHMALVFLGERQHTTSQAKRFRTRKKKTCVA